MRPRHALEDEGWRYIDAPTRFTPEYWDKYLSIFGDGNYMVLAMTTGNNRTGEPFVRGQLLVSPEGQDNAKAYAATVAPEGNA